MTADRTRPSRPSLDLPYIDRVLAQVDAGQPELVRAFGRHLHWGYWPDPVNAAATPADFAAAAGRLALEVCAAARVADGQRVPRTSRRRRGT